MLRPPPRFAQQKMKLSLEDLMKNFISTVETRFQNQEVSIRNLEIRLGQFASIIAGRTQGSLPSDTKKNSKEQVNDITIKNGKDICMQIENKVDMIESADKESEKGIWN